MKRLNRVRTLFGFLRFEALAHIAARKGHKARYTGDRKNLFDLRRAAAIQNLEAVHRIDREAA